MRRFTTLGHKPVTLALEGVHVRRPCANVSLDWKRERGETGARGARRREDTACPSSVIPDPARDPV